jgi:hypothetical protein
MPNLRQAGSNMSDKRMLILAEEIVRKINENRGDLSQGEFIEFLIESQFKTQGSHLLVMKRKNCKA